MQQVHTLAHCNSPDAEELMFLMMSVWRMKGLKEGLIWRSPTVILLVPSCLIYHAASSCLSVWPARFSRPDWAQNKSLNSSYIPPSSPSFHTEYACNISYGFRQCWMLKTLTALRHLPSLPHFLPLLPWLRSSWWRAASLSSLRLKQTSETDAALLLLLHTPFHTRHPSRPPHLALIFI